MVDVEKFDKCKNDDPGVRSIHPAKLNVRVFKTCVIQFPGPRDLSLLIAVREEDTKWRKAHDSCRFFKYSRKIVGLPRHYRYGIMQKVYKSQIYRVQTRNHPGML